MLLMHNVRTACAEVPEPVANHLAEVRAKIARSRGGSRHGRWRLAGVTGAWTLHTRVRGERRRLHNPRSADGSRSERAWGRLARPSQTIARRDCVAECGTFTSDAAPPIPVIGRA